MELRDRIITWIQSRSFANKVRGCLLEDAGDREEECVDKWIEVNGQFGVLAKRASMIFTTSYRLRLLSKWYENIEELVPDCSSSSHWKKLLNRIGLGSALATFSLGWDEVEYNKILGWLRDMEDVHFQGIDEYWIFKVLTCLCTIRPTWLVLCIKPYRIGINIKHSMLRLPLLVFKLLQISKSHRPLCLIR